MPPPRRTSWPADPRLIPSFWCNANAEEAAQFYAAAIPGAGVGSIVRYPTEGLLDFQKPMAGQPLTVDVELPGLRVSLINAGPEFRPNPSVGLMATFEPSAYGSVEAAGAALDAVHDALIDGGSTLMPLDAYPFAPRYAWVEDRFGVSWQLMVGRSAEGAPHDAPTSDADASVADSAAQPTVIPALMFCGDAQNRCTEATDLYVRTLPGSRVIARHTYPQATGPATADSVMFSLVELTGQPVAAMDSGVEQSFTFTEGGSLIARADGQAQLDAWWAALSSVPESEQCGWCKDAHGLSWQIVPANLDELMTAPGAYGRLMGMGKIDIETLRGE